MKTAPLSGLRAWLIQRLTAVYLLVALPLFIASFAFYPPVRTTHGERAHRVRSL